MAQSPGHQKWPEHKVQEKALGERVQVLLEGELLAESQAAIEVDEDDQPPRLYIPRQDVDMDKLSPSNKTSSCPFKGRAHYFNLRVGVKELQDMAWSYAEPYDEHSGLRDHIAFYDDIPELEVRHLH